MNIGDVVAKISRRKEDRVIYFIFLPTMNVFKYLCYLHKCIDKLDMIGNTDSCFNSTFVSYLVCNDEGW